MDGAILPINPAVPVDDKPLNRRQKAKQRTTSKILDAAREAFATNAYDLVTMRDLAKAIGMSTGALFSNFADKEALWRAAMETEPPVDTLGRRRRLDRRHRVLELIAGAEDAEGAGEDMQTLARWAIDGVLFSTDVETRRVVHAWFRGYYVAERDEGGIPGDPDVKAAAEIAELEEPRQ